MELSTELSIRDVLVEALKDGTSRLGRQWAIEVLCLDEESERRLMEYLCDDGIYGGGVGPLGDKVREEVMLKGHMRDLFGPGQSTMLGVRVGFGYPELRATTYKEISKTLLSDDLNYTQP